MRVEQAQGKTVPNAFLLGAVMDLAFVAAALLSMGSAPTKHATFALEAAQPRTAEVVSITADGTSPRKEIADTDSLDLQLD